VGGEKENGTVLSHSMRRGKTRPCALVLGEKPVLPLVRDEKSGGVDSETRMGGNVGDQVLLGKGGGAKRKTCGSPRSPDGKKKIF